MDNLSVHSFLYIKVCSRPRCVPYYFHGRVYPICQRYSSVHEYSHVLRTPPPAVFDREDEFSKISKRGDVNLRFSINVRELAKKAGFCKMGDV